MGGESPPKKTGTTNVPEELEIMDNYCLGLIAAMPEEIAPLLRRIPAYRKEAAAGAKIYRFELGGAPVVLVESGMGPRKAAVAAERLISIASPNMILNFGFGGGVLPGLNVGEVVLAERVMKLESGRAAEGARPDGRLSTLLLDSCTVEGIKVKSGTFLTAAAIMNKKDVAGSLAAGIRHPVLEMETAAIVATAERAGIPVVAIRAISDAADEELGFSLEEFCDADLNISIPRVLGCVARKPWIIPQLMRLSRNSRTAGSNLAACVEVALKALATAAGRS